MIKTSQQKQLDLTQDLSLLPLTFPEVKSQEPQFLDIPSIQDTDVSSCSKTPLKSQRKPESSKSVPNPLNFILIDDDDDDSTATADSQKAISLISPIKSTNPPAPQEKPSLFNSNVKRFSDAPLADILTKKTIISQEGSNSEVQTKIQNEPIDDLLTKQIGESSEFRCLRPSWGPNTGLTKVVAIDCEMVRVEGQAQALARCSIVNYDGHVLFDSMIKPEKRVIDHLTWVSGIRPCHLAKSLPFKHHKDKIYGILKDAIIVGHTLKCDFEALDFRPKAENVRDIALYNAVKMNNNALSLKKLASKYLNISIQRGAHDSIEDAKTAMALYRKLETQWEKDREAAVMRRKY